MQHFREIIRFNCCRPNKINK